MGATMAPASPRALLLDDRPTTPWCRHEDRPNGIPITTRRWDGLVCFVNVNTRPGKTNLLDR
jgi:hypothetical protein